MISYGFILSINLITKAKISQQLYEDQGFIQARNWDFYA